MSEDNMRPAEPDLEDDLRSEYDFSGAVQGKHYQAYRRGTNVVFLDPDIAKIFTSSEAVNQALRVLLDLERQQAEKRSA